MSTSQDGPLRVVLVAGGVCCVCSVVVAAVVQLLEPRIAANREAARQAHILDLIRRQPALKEMFDELGGVDVTARVVELETGAYAGGTEPGQLDTTRAAEDPLRSIALPPERDLAGIKRRANETVVYEVEREGRLELVILPVYGQGYASTLRGFLALAGDGNTVIGLTFHEHGETPGLGAEIEAAWFSGQFAGKTVRDAEHRVRLGVADDGAPPGSPYLVDGISGATRTSQGVTNLLRFWLGPDGFGPYLQRIGR